MFIEWSLVVFHLVFVQFYNPENHLKYIKANKGVVLKNYLTSATLPNKHKLHFLSLVVINTILSMIFYFAF